MARPPGGESLAEAMRRLKDLLADLALNARQCRMVALVTHDVLIRLALLTAAGEGAGGFRRITVAPASVHPLLLRGTRLLAAKPGLSNLENAHV